MASRSPSRSEGEVMSSSESEAKANNSRSSVKGPNVDRATRPYLAPYAPPAKRNRSRSRSRSRSPYRAPRAEKRRREDEHPRDRHRNDPRTFHVRYEDDEPRHRRQRSTDYHQSKRSRTYSRSRSRSPYRHSRAHSRDERPRHERQEEKPKHGRAYSDQKDNVEASAPPRAQPNEKANVVIDKTSGQNEQRYITSLPQVEKAENSSNEQEDTEANTNAIAAPELDEAARIEERRKRREAIKNKYRGQATPLLVQALHLGGSPSQVSPVSDTAPSSPGRSSTHQVGNVESGARTRDASPSADSPRSTGLSAPGSPADFASPPSQDLANENSGSPTADEPSAADYDPTVDMQEERARHDKRMFKEDDRSLEAADQQVGTRDHDNTVSEPPASKSRAEFDMFADQDDDDDMFADAPTEKKIENKTAQTLDARLLDNWDDHEGYYITIIGELIDSRYQVTQTLGRGMFSSVVRAMDSQTQQDVAIKIVRNNESMRKAGNKEIDILKDIAANDPEDKKHLIRLLRSFDHKGHLCMVFENLSMNLREVLKKFGRDIGINIKGVRAYSQQLFLGLSLLKKCQYLHADLKPDNILVNDARNILKVCDLGSASPITENATAPYLVSRFYRAPEVILGIPYDYGIDMWSIGCTLFELYTGKILFTGRNNNGMLKAIMDCRGKFPHKVLRRGSLIYDYFDDLLNFKSEEIDKLTGRVVTKLVDVKAKPARDLRSRLIPKGKRMDEQERKEVELLLDLLEKCLDLRPEKRITPMEALKHPFVMRTKT
jgi:serine/threonine-protein kinase PRP4